LKWRNKIDSAERRLSKWRESAKKNVRLYESSAENGSEKPQSFNILYSNTETLRTSIYSNEPKPRVVPRFKDGKPLPDKVASILERALDFEVSESGLPDVFKEVVQSGLLTGFGLPRVTYKPQFVMMPDAMGIPQQQIGFQKLEIECVDYDQVVYEVTKKAKDRRWIAFCHYYNQKDLADKLELSHEQCAMQAYNVSGENESDNTSQMCKVWEVWDKDTRSVFYIVDGYAEAVKVTPDPYKLEQFFPCPNPLQFLKRIGSTVPLPEYTAYKKLAESLERISARIDKIVGYIKVSGVYDSASDDLKGLLTATDGEMLAANMMALGEKGGLAKVFELLPMQEIAQTLRELVSQREQIKQAIFEITGISDIMRGSTQASESATAQRIKGNFGTLRIQERQKAVASCVRDTIAIMGELIANHYQPNVLMLMTGEELPEQPLAPAMPQIDPMTGQPMPAPKQEPSWPEVMQVMRDDSVRKFIVDIETDSTISADEEAEQKQAIELVTAVTQYITNMAPLVQAGAVPQDVAKELLMVAVRRFKGVRAFEDALDKWAAPAPAMPPMGQQMGTM
jgi:hypothetical protein